MKHFNKALTLVCLLTLVTFSQEAFSQMYWNNAASFEGNNTSYVAVPNSATINIVTSFTIEAWINPSTISGLAKGIVSKGGVLGGSLRYGIRLNNEGRISILTNGSIRITSRVSNPVSINKWTHVSATYSAATGLFSIYINGIPDTTAVIGGAIPASNTDSLYIGISGNTTPFAGQIDEVRLWNTELTASEIASYERLTLGASTGIYSRLKMSIAFQGENVSADPLKDMSGNGNNAYSRNTVFSTPNFSAGGTVFRPLHTVTQNESLDLDGTEDYLSGADNSSINPDSAITLECWVYPRTNSACRIISKGNNYGIIYTGNRINGLINNNVIQSLISIPLNQWSYLVFTYRNSGDYIFYINGLNVKSGNTALGNINITGDSLFVGGGPGGIGDLNGYLDEVRITNTAKSQEEIHNYNYASLDKIHDPNVILKNVNYGFDGNTFDNVGDGGPVLIFRGDAKFTYSGAIRQPVSPLNQDKDLQFSRAFYIKTANKRIPETLTSGTITDSLNINLETQINDLNLFVGINHENSADLNITLISPSGDSALIFSNTLSNSYDNNVISIFDDQADSSLKNLTYASFYAKLKPQNSVNSAFTGKSSKGFWKIRISDVNTANTGMLYGWGIQINNADKRAKNLNLSAMIQGFYNPASNKMIPDTLSVRIHSLNFNATSKAVIDPDGNCYLSFTPSGLLTDGKSFLVEVHHRNSIETWAAQNYKFINSEVNIDFLNSTSEVLGGNVINADNSPVRYAIYGGDIGQDGLVDLNDVVAVFNSASAFQTGYIIQDVTGDNISDLTDVVLVFNNSVNFVHSVVP
ncbi:MAG TPA: proprotein convertase P-domain-containing protein [Ignavibacteria bacterium]|nr:proprotein convertase P-domain-containing protein [Ignavibacteria bacterium]